MRAIAIRSDHLVVGDVRVSYGALELLTMPGDYYVQISCVAGGELCISSERHDPQAMARMLARVGQLEFENEALRDAVLELASRPKALR